MKYFPPAIFWIWQSSPLIKLFFPMYFWSKFVLGSWLMAYEVLCCCSWFVRASLTFPSSVSCLGKISVSRLPHEIQLMLSVIFWIFFYLTLSAVKPSPSKKYFFPAIFGTWQSSSPWMKLFSPPIFWKILGLDSWQSHLLRWNILPRILLVIVKSCPSPWIKFPANETLIASPRK